MSLLSAVLLWPEAMHDAATAVLPSDFFDVEHGQLWATMLGMWRSGQRFDPVDVRARGLEDYQVDLGDTIQQAMSVIASPSLIRRYVSIVVGHAQARRLQHLLHSVADEAFDHSKDAAILADELIANLRQIQRSASEDLPEDVMPVPLFIEAATNAMKDRSSEWLIPGIIGPGERLIVVGAEGSGKMVLLRQIVQLAAAGLHPLLEGDRIEPLTTLLVDAENPIRPVLSTMGPVSYGLKRHQLSDENCWIWHRPGGIDLRSREGRSELESILLQVQPNLVAMGPLYKLFHRERHESDEEAAVGVQMILDDLRTRHNFALMLEHHAPKGSGGAREMVPFGSSAWLRWPEYGIAMVRKNLPGEAREIEIGRWRDDRVPATWPTDLRPGEAPFLWTTIWETGQIQHGQRPWD